MIRGFCPCFFRDSVVATNNQNKELETNIVGTQPDISAPPLEVEAIGNTTLREIKEQMNLQTEESLIRNEELYTKQLLRKNQLSQIEEAKYQGTLAQMQQITQFAETDKKNRSTEAILNQAKQTELEALQKRHQEATLPGNTQKKMPI